MAIPGQGIDPNLISGVFDPWVQALERSDLERKLAGLPRGRGGGVDYNAATIALMSRHPLAAQQMMKLAEHQATAGNRAAHLDIARQQLGLQRDAADKLSKYEDDDGNVFVVREVSGQGRWITGPNAGRDFQLNVMPRSGAVGTNKPVSAAPADPAAVAQSPTPSPTVAPRPQQAGPATVPSPAPSPVIPDDDLRLLRETLGTPGYESGIAAAAQHFNIPPAQVKQLVEGRSDLNVPSGTYAGGVQRAQGPQLGDLPPEIGQAFAQAEGPVPGLTPAAPRPPPGPVDPNKPIGSQFQPSPKDEREARKAYAKKRAEEQGQQAAKDEARAADLQPYLKHIATAQSAFDKIEKAGLANRAAQNPISSTALVYGRGAQKLIGGALGAKDKPGNFAQGIDAMDTYQRSIAQIQLLAQQAMKGLGAMSDADARRIEQSVPSLNSNDTAEVKAALADIRDVLIRNIRRGGMEAR